MATSKYRLDLERQQRNISLQLLKCLLKDVVTEEDDPENFALALRFCTDTFTDKNRPQLPLIERKQLKKVFKDICDKLHIHSLHNKANKLSYIFNLLETATLTQNENNPNNSNGCLYKDENDDVIVKVINLLLLLSKTPTKTDHGVPDTDAYHLEKNKDENWQSEHTSNEVKCNDEDTSCDEEGELKDWLEEFNNESDDSYSDLEESAKDRKPEIEKPGYVKTQEKSGSIPDKDGLLDIDYVYRNHREPEDKANELALHDLNLEGDENVEQLNKQSVAALVRNQLLQTYKKVESSCEKPPISYELVEKIKVVREINLMRGVILAFRGIETPGIFQIERFSNGDVLIKPSENMNTLVYTSPSTYRNIVSFSSRAATLMCRLANYADHSNDDLYEKEGHRMKTLTELWFCFAIGQELKVIVGALNDIECFLQKPGNSLIMNNCTSKRERFVPTPTMNLLMFWLKPFVDLLEKLYRLVTELKVICCKNESKRSISCKIIDTLYKKWREEAVCSKGMGYFTSTIDTLYNRKDVRVAFGNSPDCDSYYDVLSRIFFTCLNPLLEMIGDFIHSGELNTRSEEFFIKKKQSKAQVSTSKCTRTTGSTCEGCDIWYGCYVVNSCVPSFLRCLSSSILSCGKSIQIVKSTRFDDSFFNKDKILADSQYSNIFETKFRGSIGRSTNHDSNLNSTPVQDSVVTATYNHVPDIFLNKFILVHIRNRCQAVNAELLNSVVRSELLMRWLSILRAILLIQNESLLLSFLYDLFRAADGQRKMSNRTSDFSDVGLCRIPTGPVSLNNSDVKDLESTLTANLRNNMADEYDDSITDLFTVRLQNQPDKAKSKKAHGYGHSPVKQAIDLVEICCKVPFPLDIIVDERSMKLYQKIFRFLVKVKQANYQLNHMQHHMRRFSLLSAHKGTLISENTKKRFHQLNIMLMSKSHFVRNLHDCTMHRLVDVSWTKFTLQLEKARDIEELRSMHFEYMEKLCACCLISPTQPDTIVPVMDATLEILATSLRFKFLAETFISSTIDPNGVDNSISDSQWKTLLSLHQRFVNAKTFMKKLVEKPSLGHTKMHGFIKSLGL